MYPNLYYFFKDVFGISLPFLKLVNSFGFFMALSFLAAAWLAVKEFKRKQAAGVFSYTQKTIVVGKAPTIEAVLPSFFWGLLAGYKLLGLLMADGALDDPQSFLFSEKGSIPWGIFAGVCFAGWKWWEINKEKLPTPETKVVRIWPGDRIGTITFIAAAAGIIGAKIFDNLENWDRFIQDPIGNLFSRSGLTFYGGLIVATFALWYYFKRKKISFIHVCDATAPSLMIAYSIGRLGCQVSGDGDWGIVNSAYLTHLDGRVVPSSPGTLDTAFAMYGRFYVNNIGDSVQHKAVKAFAGLPDWLFANCYPHNTNKIGVSTLRCTFDDYCYPLPMPVFPTPLYEFVMALLLFGLLWAIRKKIKLPGRLFAIYLVVNGLERLLIEQIRVNTKYTIFGLHPTQAELISGLLIVSGIFLYWYAPKINIPPPKPILAEEAIPRET